FDLSEFDLVISNCHCVSKGVITKPETMHISYCHAPIRYVWTPWLDPRLSGSFIKQKLASFLRVWDFQAAQRVDYFAANSFNIAQRIKKYYKKDADVIYPPVRTSLFKPDLSVKDLGDYYLLVGRLVSYKNPSIVIKAFNELGFKLKVIGTGPELSNLMKIAKGNIEFLGKVDDFELKKYYASSLAFVFPSEEDFGIVPVEAMASGRPVVAFRQGGATETIVEHVTGEFFDEPTTESLVDKLRVFNPMKYDSRVIQKRALEFDEEIFKKKFSEYVTIKINQ
ncbi:MAG: glycosyltransferase, partial [Candidatus Berkelbacteria bacterium]|nr:glycosyltransferase [Candidatus Berkelbacteria bacterium]